MPIPGWTHPDYTSDLLFEYDKYSKMPVSSLTVDARRGVEFYLSDIRADTAAPRSVEKWIGFVHELDAFFEENGRLPRASARRPRPDTVEQALVERIIYQRRPSVRAAHCTYQARRLESIPGFSWAPRDDLWRARFAGYQDFWSSNHRPPNRRSADLNEAALGRWAEEQRAHFRNKTIRPERARALRTARFRVL